MSGITSQNERGQGVSHATGESKVPSSVQDKVPKGVEESLPDSVSRLPCSVVVGDVLS